MSRPMIGIVANYFESQGSVKAHSRLNAAYSDAVMLAGGLPVILPPMEDGPAIEQFLDGVGAILFGGGYDIDPARFGQPRHGRTELLSPRLEPFVFDVFVRADARGRLPMLGICLGAQLFNVARGGTLHQHLPDVPRQAPINHVSPKESQYAGGRAAHRVRVQPGTKLAGWLGRSGEIEANSGHHQAIDQIGHGFIVSARSEDGVAEAIEDPSRPFVTAVQWHPEDMTDRPEHLALWKAFVASAC